MNDSTTKPRLNKEYAVLQTATIDVKILRLAKKQVTMSVFRQLEIKCPFLPIEAETSDCVELRGQVWGRVKYVWKDSPGWADQYLVWQMGNTLYTWPLGECDGGPSYLFIEDLKSYIGLDELKSTFMWFLDGEDLKNNIRKSGEEIVRWLKENEDLYEKAVEELDVEREKDKEYKYFEGPEESNYGCLTDYGYDDDGDETVIDDKHEHLLEVNDVCFDFQNKFEDLVRWSSDIGFIPDNNHWAGTPEELLNKAAEFAYINELRKRHLKSSFNELCCQLLLSDHLFISA